MTEERIVDCVIIERTFEKAGDAKAQWLTIKAMCEPAPDPKFRPVCFYNWSEPLGICEMSELESFVNDHPQCRLCPWGTFARPKEAVKTEKE
jgi:hypothetical protein